MCIANRKILFRFSGLGRLLPLLMGRIIILLVIFDMLRTRRPVVISGLVRRVWWRLFLLKRFRVVVLRRVGSIRRLFGTIVLRKTRKRGRLRIPLLLRVPFSVIWVGRILRRRYWFWRLISRTLWWGYFRPTRRVPRKVPLYRGRFMGGLPTLRLFRWSIKRNILIIVLIIIG